MHTQPAAPILPCVSSVAVEVHLEGHLSRDALERALERVVPHLSRAAGLAGLFIDCRGMTDYDLDARHAFVEWNRKWRPRVRRVAIVTSNRLYHMVIGGMALASGQAMRAFADADAARGWLES